MAGRDVVNEDLAEAFQGVSYAVVRLREIGLTDKGIVQLVHVVSDFAAYNRLNLALDTDYDYRDMWRSLGFGWQPVAGQPAGDNTRGVR